jgi:hypothetical protein
MRFQKTVNGDPLGRRRDPAGAQFADKFGFIQGFHGDTF